MTTYDDFDDDDLYEDEEPASPLNDSESLLRRAVDIIATARTMPLSSSPMINREEIIELLEEAVHRMPDERTEVVRAAEMRARKIVEAAENEARRMKLEIEDFCDQRLASFEILLERTLKTVVVGREKLNGRIHDTRPPAPPDPEPVSNFFDQDEY